MALDGWAASAGVHGCNPFRALNKDGGLAGRVHTKGGSYGYLHIDVKTC